MQIRFIAVQDWSN